MYQVNGYEQPPLWLIPTSAFTPAEVSEQRNHRLNLLSAPPSKSAEGYSPTPVHLLQIACIFIAL